MALSHKEKIRDLVVKNKTRKHRSSAALWAQSKQRRTKQSVIQLELRDGFFNRPKVYALSALDLGV